MRRMLSLVAAAFVMAAMLALTAGPVFAGGGGKTVVYWRFDGMLVIRITPWPSFQPDLCERR